MATNTPRIDLRLSQQSLADIKSFREEMEQTQKRTQELKQDLKQMDDLFKAMKMKSAAIGPGGLGAFSEGTRFRDARKVEATQRLGTAIGQQLELQRQTLALSKQGVTYTQKQGQLQEALNLNLRASAKSIEKITDLKQVQNRLEATRVRLGLEAANGNKSAVRSSQRLIDLLERRVELLKQEAKERAKSEKAMKRMSDSEMANRQRQMSMRRLFGDGGASLFAVQAGVLSNYAIMNQATGGVGNAASFTQDLDLSMRNLQAITRTTDGDMVNLKETLVSISEQTKFTAVDVANAAVTLGQAGLSTKEITDAAAAVSLLATATGTELPRAVDIATSVLGVFNMESSQMSTVANVMTEAVNSSKLNIEKLTLGLQYSGNIAAQSGIRFDELTAALGAMANAGIRSGSTLGTGMRQILISLQKPSQELMAVMERLGLTMEDIDVRSQGLYGAMANLRDAGFTSGDAIRAFQVRAAAAYNALSGNLDQMIDLETAFQGTAASIQANETQMRSFSNQWARFGSVAGSVASTALEPALFLFRDMVSSLSDLLEGFRAQSTTLRAMGSGVTALVTAFAAWKLTRLVAGVTSLVLGLRKGTKATRGLSAATIANNAAMTGAISRMRLYHRWFQINTVSAAAFSRTLLRLATGPVGLLAMGFGTFALQLGAFRNEADLVNNSLDEAQTQFDRAKGEVESYAQGIGTINEKISELLNRYDRLSSDNRLLQSEIESIKSQFVSMGLDITDVGGTVDELIANLRELRREMSEEYLVKIKVTREELGVLQDQLQSTRQQQSNQLRSYIGKEYNLQNRVRDSGIDFRGIAETAAPFMNANQTYDEARMDLVAAKRRQQKLERELKDAAETPFSRGRDDVLRDELKILKEVVRQAEAIVATIGEVEKKTKEQESLGREARTAEQKTTPEVSGLFDTATELQIRAPGRMAAAGKGFENDALGRYEALKVEADTLTAEQDRLREQLQAMLNFGMVNITNQNEIETLLNQVQGEVEVRLIEAAEAAGKVEEQLASNAVAALRKQVQQDASSLRGSSSKQEVDANFEKYQASLADYAEARRAQIDKTIEDISLRAEALASLEDELAAMQDEATADYDEVVDDIAADAEKLREEALQKEVDAADAAYDRAVTLAKAAETLKERNDYLKQAMAAIKRRLSAALALVGIKYGDNPDALGAATEELETEAADDRDGVRKVRTSPLGDKKRGGGGREKDAIKEWVKAATDQVEATSMAVAQGFFEPGAAVDSIETTLNSAKSKMEGITSQIEALRSRALNGQLTSEEQERLNTLVEQHGVLTKFVADQQERLILLKYQEGDLMGGLTLQVEQFAKSSLDLTKTLASGIDSMLGGLTGALSEFFTSWANGTKSGKEAFRDLAASVIKSMQNIFAQMLAVYMLQRLMGFLFPGANIPQQSLGQIAGGMFGMREGGQVKVRHAAQGERVRGNLNRDSQPYELMDGEYVLRRSAAQSIGYDKLDEMNAMGNRTVAQSPMKDTTPLANKKGEGGDMNIYLVDERSQAGPMGPKDVLAIIGDDISRGGTTKKLIKSVAQGAM